MLIKPRRKFSSTFFRSKQLCVDAFEYLANEGFLFHMNVSILLSVSSKKINRAVDIGVAQNVYVTVLLF